MDLRLPLLNFSVKIRKRSKVKRTKKSEKKLINTYAKSKKRKKRKKKKKNERKQGMKKALGTREANEYAFFVHIFFLSFSRSKTIYRLSACNFFFWIIIYIPSILHSTATALLSIIMFCLIMIGPFLFCYIAGSTRDRLKNKLRLKGFDQGQGRSK